MTYTADHAVLPAKNILMFIAMICALLFFANVFRRTWLLPGSASALLVLSAILLGGVWPAIVQQFQVKPSEPDKEAPYIEQEHRGHARRRTASATVKVERLRRRPRPLSESKLGATPRRCPASG